MTRRPLTGLAMLALCFVATTARAQQPGLAPGAAPAQAAPGEPTFPAGPPAPPAAEVAPPADAPAPVVPVPLETPSPAPGPPAPLVVAAPASGVPPTRLPMARHWWFWAGLGAAAVTVVGLAIALSPREPYVGNASPGLTSPF